MEMAIVIAGVALAFSLPGMGSAIGVGLAGAASTGVMSEDPQKFGRLLILVGLPGTQGIYGFVAGFLTLIRLGLIGAGPPLVLSPSQAWQFFFAALPVALTCLISAIHQGKVCAGGVEMTAKQPAESGKAMVMAIFVEFYAVLGFVATFLLLFVGIKL